MNASPVIVPLAEADDLSLAGGKAINLYRLMQAGLPVPNGFVVTTAAFRQAAHSDAMPTDLSKRIRQAYTALAQPLVAVRSSATAEDLTDVSMAGQYETFLNVSGADAVIEAVQRCWQSLQAERVQTYLREHAIDPANVAVAVVVQELVPAEVAGVLFTANPRSGAPHEIVVEAVYGLGEGLVSGNIQPDVYRVQADTGDVLDIQIAAKNKALRPGDNVYQPVPETQAAKSCLKYEQLQDLRRLGRRAQRYFGAPQDLEWALDNSGIHVLQARPITTLDATRVYHTLLEETRRFLKDECTQGRGPWVRHNLSETLPWPTPLTWSLIRAFMSGAGGFGRMHRELGFAPSHAVKETGFLSLIAGEIYMDCARLPELFQKDYPYTYDLEALKRNPDAAQQPPTLPTGSHRKLAAAARLGTAVTNKIRDLAQNLDRAFDEEFAARVQAWCDEQAELDLRALSEGALIDLWQVRQATVLDDFGATVFLPSMVEALAVADLQAFLSEHCWQDDPKALCQQLSISPQGDVTLQSNIELQEAAQGKRSLDSWLARYGYRGPGEFDLASPRWIERQAELQRLAAPLADAAPVTERHHARLQAAAACLTRLKQQLPTKLATQLDSHVTRLQRYVRFREDGKAVFIRALTQLRWTALEFARRLDLDEAAFYLEADELVMALKKGFVPQDRIYQRQLQHQAAQKFTLPHVIAASDIAKLGETTLPERSDAFSALAVASGTCTGPARIVLDPTRASDLGKNYILVCPSTDPAWTPLFVAAAGLILERGGALSHGAIVAREMGLPAVVLANATRLFAEGETLTLDGMRGRIMRSDTTGDNDTDQADTQVSYDQRPPGVGRREARANQLGLCAAALWGLMLLVVYLLPGSWLKEPAFALIDTLLWPLVRNLGMAWTVTAVGACFAILPLLIQRWGTDKTRLLEAKKRAALLQKRARGLPAQSARRQALLATAAPVTLRMLKASMASLAWVLGPMFLVFLWMPERLDPAAWNADPGGLVTVVAELDGEYQSPVTCRVPAPLSLEPATPRTQTLPPIRATLEGLRQEWQSTGDLGDYPWQLQTAGEQAAEVLLTSLSQYLASAVPPQKLTWMIRVPEAAVGHYPVTLSLPDKTQCELTLAFGNEQPPRPTVIEGDGAPLMQMEAVYPRALQQRRFWTPLKAVGGPAWDLGWLGVYILSYLLVMMVTKRLLRVP